LVGGKSGLAKGVLVELGEVAVKSEDAKNNESRNEAKKGGLCRATFRKGKSRSERRRRSRWRSTARWKVRREVGEVGRIWTTVEPGRDRSYRFLEIGLPKAV